MSLQHELEIFSAVEGIQSAIDSLKSANSELCITDMDSGSTTIAIENISEAIAKLTSAQVKLCRALVIELLP